MRARGIQVLSYQKPCYYHYYYYYYYYYHLIIISIIYLFNLRSLTAVCLLNCQCPEDSYIIDGYPCDQTKTVRSTNSERGILFRLCHGPLHFTNFPELPIERSSVFATKSKEISKFHNHSPRSYFPFHGFFLRLWVPFLEAFHKECLIEKNQWCVTLKKNYLTYNNCNVFTCVHVVDGQKSICRFMVQFCVIFSALSLSFTK